MRPYLEHRTEQLRGGAQVPDSFPEHLHPQAELVFVFSGRVVMRVDGRERLLLPGSLCLCFPGVTHGYVRSQDAQALMLIFSPALIAEFSALLTGRRPENPVLPAAALPEDVAPCARRLVEELAGGADELVLRGYLQVILARTLPRMPLGERRGEETGVVYRLLQYLSIHFAEPLTLDDLARALCVSPSHLSHTFSRRLGTSFRAYVNALRIDQACTLLRRTDYSITRIAFECGFETQRTFNRAFAGQLGMTPGAYRAQGGRPSHGADESSRHP